MSLWMGRHSRPSEAGRSHDDRSSTVVNAPSLFPRGRWVDDVCAHAGRSLPLLCTSTWPGRGKLGKTQSRISRISSKHGTSTAGTGTKPSAKPAHLLS